MKLLKKAIIYVLIYVLSVQLQYLPFISGNLVYGAKLKITTIDIFVENNESLSKRMTKFINDELKSKNRIEYFEHQITSNKVEKKVRKFDESKFKDSVELLKGIETSLSIQEYALAIESCQQAIDIYDENFENLKNFQPLYELYLKKSFIENLEGLEEDSKASLKQAISIGRNNTFASSKFSPQFVVKYKRERQRMQTTTDNFITINSSASYEVFIDGVFVGNSPIKVNLLTPGKHYVVVVNEDQIVKKETVELQKGGKVIDIKSDSTSESVNTSDLSAVLFEINKSLAKKQINSSLKNNLKVISEQKGADFILFGYTNKKTDINEAHLHLYSKDKNQIAYLTKGDFDDDLLTGDVEGLRIGNETVAAMDKFDTLKIIPLGDESKTTLKEVNFEQFKEVVIAGEIDVNKVPDETNVVKTDVKTDDVKKDEVKTAIKDDVKKDEVKKDETKKDIKIDDADYSKLDKKDDSLSVVDDKDNKYKKDKEDEFNIFTQWWFWTAVVVVAGGTGAGIYFISNDSGTSTTNGVITW